jgi:excisionase family DNA binding protein
MKMTENRFDPSALTSRQLRELDRLSEAVLADERPALVGREGVRLELPEPIFNLLARVVRTMREGKAVVLLPESESMTTQAAADFLGVSRPFVVDLLEKDAMPHHKVGTHRRVYLKDLMKYQRQRDTRHRATLDDLRRKVDAAGLYEKGTGGSGER